MSVTDYEAATILSEYLLFHYGDAERLLPWKEGPTGALDFPRRCVEKTFDPALLPSGGGRILDLGCAVGRSTFELSRYGAEVIGIDYSQQFILAAQQLAEGRKAPYRIHETGNWFSDAEATAPESAVLEKVQFEVGDAHALRADLGDFDLVLACNLLCRMAEPKRLLERFDTLVKSGGQLVLTTPHTWMEAFTPPENWLAASKEGRVSTDALAEALGDGFELVKQVDLPFLIREHRRKFQWSVAEATVWRKR